MSMNFNRTRNRPKEDGDKHVWCFQYFQDIRSAGLNKLEQEELSDNSSCKQSFSFPVKLLRRKICLVTC